MFYPSPTQHQSSFRKLLPLFIGLKLALLSHTDYFSKTVILNGGFLDQKLSIDNSQLAITRWTEHFINNQYRGRCYLPKPKAEAENTVARFDTSWYHTNTEFNNCFNYTFLKQSAEEDTLRVCKSLRTLHERGAYKLGSLWTWYL